MSSQLYELYGQVDKLASPHMSSVVEPIEDSEDIDKVKYDKFKRKDSSYGEKGKDKDKDRCCKAG